MTPKRLILGLLTLIVLYIVGSSLIASWSTPQITSRLQLYQTDLLLHGMELESSDADLISARNAVLGNDPLGTALEQYESVRETAQETLENFQAKREREQSALVASADQASSDSPLSPSADSGVLRQVEASIRQQQALIDQLDMRIGILQAEQGNIDEAQQTWTAVMKRISEETPSLSFQGSSTQVVANTTDALRGLWSDPPRLLPNVEPLVQDHLEGWFRYAALTRLYTLQQRTDALVPLQAEEQAIAQQTFFKLALVGTLPVLGCFIGIVLLISLMVQRVLQGRQAILAQNGDRPWETPWDWEIIWQVLISFFIAQIFLPLFLGLLRGLGLNFSALGSRAEAVSVLTSYGLMAGFTLLVLFLSIRANRPLPEGWFAFKGGKKWIFWGSGGYLVALPLMILVSLVNQQIWQGEGGSNPLLQIVLEERDPVSLGLFFLTAAVAAPVFEETLFRGFLLPSLTRYVSVGWAIILSSFLFAIAHLSPSEVLPLTLLGSILGFVYTRSRSLLAPMLLHSLWNSITMIGLFLLGSGAK